MRKLIKVIIAVVLLFILLFISSGYFLKQECHGMWAEVPEWVCPEKKYPGWLPNYMYEIYDMAQDIEVEYVQEIRGNDVWQSPQDTERIGGDCEDWAIVIGKKLADLFYNFEPVSCIVNTWGGSTKHMWVRVYIRIGCCNSDAWDIDLTVEPRMFPARLQYDLNEKDVDRFWNIILRGE